MGSHFPKCCPIIWPVFHCWTSAFGFRNTDGVIDPVFENDSVTRANYRNMIVHNALHASGCYENNIILDSMLLLGIIHTELNTLLNSKRPNI